MNIGLKIEKQNLLQKNVKQILKRKNGITLIALVVTIVVLLLLAGVTINMALGDNGIFEKAKESQEKMNEAVQNDMEGINYLNDTINKYQDGIVTPTDPEEDGEKISKEESYVGYYADVDGDGTVDGVIFADLLIGGSGTWNPGNNTNDYAKTGGAYTIEKISSAKNYTISQESYEGRFGTQPVLKAASKSGNERFYVMALNDFDSYNNCGYYSVYTNGMSDYATATSKDFGTGKANTETMIEKWNNKSYGEQNVNTSHPDLWGIVQEKYKEGWFIPSVNEWAAFGNVFNITYSNYSETYGLSSLYWSSSQYNNERAFSIYFQGGHTPITDAYAYGMYTRLCATF